MSDSNKENRPVAAGWGHSDSEELDTQPNISKVSRGRNSTAGRPSTRGSKKAVRRISNVTKDDEDVSKILSRRSVSYADQFKHPTVKKEPKSPNLSPCQPEMDAGLSRDNMDGTTTATDGTSVEQAGHQHVHAESPLKYDFAVPVPHEVKAISPENMCQATVNQGSSSLPLQVEELRSVPSQPGTPRDPSDRQIAVPDAGLKRSMTMPSRLNLQPSKKNRGKATKVEETIGTATGPPGLETNMPSVDLGMQGTWGAPWRRGLLSAYPSMPPNLFGRRHSISVSRLSGEIIPYPTYYHRDDPAVFDTSQESMATSSSAASVENALLQFQQVEPFPSYSTPSFPTLSSSWPTSHFSSSQSHIYPSSIAPSMESSGDPRRSPDSSMRPIADSIRPNTTGSLRPALAHHLRPNAAPFGLFGLPAGHCNNASYSIDANMPFGDPSTRSSVFTSQARTQAQTQHLNHNQPDASTAPSFPIYRHEDAIFTPSTFNFSVYNNVPHSSLQYNQSWHQKPSSSYAPDNASIQTLVRPTSGSVDANASLLAQRPSSMSSYQAYDPIDTRSPDPAMNSRNMTLPMAPNPPFLTPFSFVMSPSPTTEAPSVQNSQDIIDTNVLGKSFMPSPTAELTDDEDDQEEREKRTLIATEDEHEDMHYQLEAPCFVQEEEKMKRKKKWGSKQSTAQICSCPIVHGPKVAEANLGVEPHLCTTRVSLKRIEKQGHQMCSYCIGRDSHVEHYVADCMATDQIDKLCCLYAMYKEKRSDKHWKIKDGTRWQKYWEHHRYDFVDEAYCRRLLKNHIIPSSVDDAGIVKHKQELIGEELEGAAQDGDGDDWYDISEEGQAEEDAGKESLVVEGEEEVERGRLCQTNDLGWVSMSQESDADEDSE